MDVARLVYKSGSCRLVNSEGERVTEWEYALVQLPVDRLRSQNTGKLDIRHANAEAVLNRLGRDGWEAVNLNVAGDDNGRVLFKRPIA